MLSVTRHIAWSSVVLRLQRVDGLPSMPCPRWFFSALVSLLQGGLRLGVCRTSFGLEEADRVPKLSSSARSAICSFRLGVRHRRMPWANETRGLSCRVDGAEATWSRPSPRPRHVQGGKAPRRTAAFLTTKPCRPAWRPAYRHQHHRERRRRPCVCAVPLISERKRQVESHKVHDRLSASPTTELHNR